MSKPWSWGEPDTDDRPQIECRGCGRILYGATETSEGDDAWYIEDNWYCDDCARDYFRREVSL